MANVYSIARTYRAQLLKRERSAATEMVKRYGDAWRGLRAKLDDLTSKMAEEERVGLYPTQSELTMKARYEDLMRQVRREMNSLAEYADRTITEQQKLSFGDARQMTLEMMNIADAKPEMKVSASFAMLNAPMAEFSVGMLQDGSPLREVLKDYAGKSADAIGDILTRNRILGIGSKVTARMMEKQVKDEMGENLSRALTIARTENMRAFNTTALERYAARPDIFTAWEWSADMSERTCMMCISLDGTVHPLSEPFFGTHPRCRCCPIPVMEDHNPEHETGSDWFDRQPPDVQEHMLGPAKYAAWKDNQFQLNDLVGYKDDPKWGPIRWERSLKDILEEKGKSGSLREYLHIALSHDTGWKSLLSEKALSLPEGPEISRAMDVHVTRSQIAHARRAIRAIDSVHGDGVLPRTLMENGLTPDNWDMGYIPYSNRIIVNNGGASNYEMTTVHEIGHMLDYKIFGSNEGYGSETQAEILSSWHEAIHGSEAYVKLAAARSGLLVGGEMDHLEYLLEERELFARSYAQYVAMRSGNPVLLKQLYYELESDKIAIYPNQWTVTDFKGIANSFDRLFGRLRWLK